MNHRRWLGMAAGLLLLTTAGLQAAEYTIDPMHSKVEFKVKHLGISTVTGRFEKFTGSFNYDPASVPASKAQASIDATTINTDVEKRDTHLKSPDFLDVAKFPTLTFVSTGVQDPTPEGFKLLGNLTLHGVTKPVVLDTQIGGLVDDPWGNKRAAFTASTTINRKDYGVSWNQQLKTGGLLVGEEVKIILEVEGIQKK